MFCFLMANEQMCPHELANILNYLTTTALNDQISQLQTEKFKIKTIFLTHVRCAFKLVFY